MKGEWCTGAKEKESRGNLSVIIPQPCHLSLLQKELLCGCCQVPKLPQLHDLTVGAGLTTCLLSGWHLHCGRHLRAPRLRHTGRTAVCQTVRKEGIAEIVRPLTSREHACSHRSLNPCACGLQTCSPIFSNAPKSHKCRKTAPVGAAPITVLGGPYHLSFHINTICTVIRRVMASGAVELGNGRNASERMLKRTTSHCHWAALDVICPTSQPHAL